MGGLIYDCSWKQYIINKKIYKNNSEKGDSVPMLWEERWFAVL